MLHTSVFTSLGQFGKTSWATAMSDASEAVANVYVSTTVDSTDPTHVEGSRMGIAPGAVERFNVVLADMDDEDTDYIRAGSELIINIPKQWTIANAFVGNTGFVNPVTVNGPFPDGSSQIVGTLLADLEGDDGPALRKGKTITFDLTAPSPACDKMYVMHILADGRTGDDKPIGPVAETVLQVDVPAACP